jgi:hypothetical protein
MAKIITPGKEEQKYMPSYHVKWIDGQPNQKDA